MAELVFPASILDVLLWHRELPCVRSEWLQTEEATQSFADSQLTGRKEQPHSHFYLHFLSTHLKTFRFRGFWKHTPMVVKGGTSVATPPLLILFWAQPAPIFSHYLFGFNVPPTLRGWVSVQMVHRLRTRKWSRVLACHGMLQRDPEAHGSGRGGPRRDRAAGALWRQPGVRRDHRVVVLMSSKNNNRLSLLRCQWKNKLYCNSNFCMWFWKKQKSVVKRGSSDNLKENYSLVYVRDR